MQDRTDFPPPAQASEPRDRADVEAAAPADAARPQSGGQFARMSLPTKLLAITILFVMLAEVLVFVPSIASFRVNWLNERLTSARLAALAAEARPDGRA